jgi:hypothetical protein
MRLPGLAVVSLALIVVTACGGGGDSSPTEPPAPPVPLEGNWSGSVTITSPTSTTCTMSLDLALDQGAYFGNWDARCPDGTQGNGVVLVTPLIANQVIVSGLGLRSTSVFGGCGWGSTALREGNRLRAEDWSTTQNCATGPVLRGRLELTKR